jgi:hypothetical protein
MSRVCFCLWSWLLKQKIKATNSLREPDGMDFLLFQVFLFFLIPGDKNNPDVSDVVEKVRFLIHQSYHPNDQVEVTKAPYQLTRRGWGEFTARVLIFFKNSQQNKSLNILHDLKLDKTYTGLQTLGAETVADVWLYQDPEKENKN